MQGPRPRQPLRRRHELLPEHRSGQSLADRHGQRPAGRRPHRGAAAMTSRPPAEGSKRVPELAPIRYGRMAESPFRFYRAAAAIMAGDLAGTPRSGITAQLCGDAHLLNFRRLLERYVKTLQPDRRFLLEQYRIGDMARKVVGVGSVGTRCWIALLLGRDGEDPLFLQAKEADESVPAPFFDRALVTFAELYADQNERDHQALVDAVRTGRVTAAAA
ncbi:DUF2252 family protein [Streptomyces sp. NPDC001165]|uniref:DUF2252 family protein n=1 Tax=Streptomyces sp. NPDC001165 TaxID=3364546 RepID=UPI0036A835E1